MGLSFGSAHFPQKTEVPSENNDCCQVQSFRTAPPQASASLTGMSWSDAARSGGVGCWGKTQTGAAALQAHLTATSRLRVRESAQLALWNNPKLD